MDAGQGRPVRAHAFVMKKSDFYFDLPERLIAQHPLEQRDASRLMVLDRKDGSVAHRHFHDMIEYVKPGDCVVFNNSRVIPARLMGHAVGHVTPIEVLLLTDPVDEMWVESVPEFDGTRFQSISKGEVDLDDDSDDDGEREQQRQTFADLLSWLGEALSDEVKEVRLSHRLSTSPACIVGDDNDMSPTLEKMYRAMGQQLPPVKRILEINPGHPLVEGLRKSYAEHGAREDLAETAQLLHGMALLAEGGELRE